MYQQTQTYLVQLTALLQKHALWQSEPIDAEALLSNTPFCHDTMAFEQWLQFIFIPKLVEMINQQRSLPSKISLTPMAEEAFKHLSTSTKPLIDIIRKIDKTLTEQRKLDE